MYYTTYLSYSREISNDIGTCITGSPVREWAIDGGFGGFDKEKLDDILILLQYKLS
jgi:hypothetical protein